MFFSGGGDLGRCPAGGQHIAGNGYAVQAGDGGAGLQAGWRRCGKCQGLTLAGDKPGACPAGGTHDTAASPSYAAALQPVAPRSSRPALKPQLFLAESYQLSNFRGDLLRDELVATMQPMLPHQTVTCRVLTRKRTTEEEKRGSTVLDAQSADAAQSFNQQLKQSSEQKFEDERYDYATQANFHGKGSVGFGSASARAHFDINGSTNNVRQELANSTEQALDSQVSQANQARRESVRVSSGESKVETTNETEVTVTTTNPSDQVKNFGIYQLKQEHISILSLVDAQVAFLNGDPKATRTVPLFRLDELLGDVIEAEEERGDQGADPRLPRPGARQQRPGSEPRAGRFQPARRLHRG